MIGCGVIPSGDAFASAMIGFLDCQALTLGSRGYMALAAPGSTAALVLTVALTLLIAFVGYRMLFGETPTLREGVLTFVKIGIVLALATNWPAYQTMVFDVMLRTPADLAAEIGAPAALPGAAGGLAGRLDGVDRQFRTLAAYGPGLQMIDVRTRPPVAPPLFIGFDTFALGGAQILFLLGALGAFALVRLGASLLLALGPLFLAFLLFEGTRGLFMGWLRGLIGMTLGALATAIALGVELALLEPWLASLVATRMGEQPITGMPATVLTATAVFDLAIFGLLLVAARVAAGLRWPQAASASGGVRGTADAVTDRQVAVTGHTASASGQPRSRAAMVADSIASGQRREERALTSRMMMTTANSASGTSASAFATVSAAGRTPLGRSFRRRTGTRHSARATVRDRG